jgi:hypothetical protein
MNEVSNKQYISDIINKEEIDKWSNNEIVFIEAPTGCGKSHFIKNVLSEHDRNKKILILVNRILIKSQSEKELLRQDIDNVTITTYQNIANKILLRKEIEFDNYDYIICDESHFFCEDSEYIYEGDLVFDWVMSRSGIKIFMTATGYYVRSYLKYELGLKIKLYQIKNTYDFIEKLYFYEDDDVIKKLLLDLPPDEKAIYFTSAKKAYETSKLLESCVFYCSKNNHSYCSYVNKESIEYLEENENFQEQIMCTTKVMDCGVNIKDTDLKHIIVDMADISSLIQCIGRKRIQDNEKIILYIKDKKGNSIVRRLESIQNKLNYANILFEKGSIALVQENAHRNTYGNLIYDVINKNELKLEKKVNDLMYFTYKLNEEIYTKILQDKEDGFKNKLFERMNIDMPYTYLEQELDALKLEHILDKLVGVKMFKDEQKDFKELLLRELLNAPKSNHGSIGLKTINALFDENKINYIVNNKREKSGEFRDQTYWVISKL